MCFSPQEIARSCYELGAGAGTRPRPASSRVIYNEDLFPPVVIALQPQPADFTAGQPTASEGTRATACARQLSPPLSLHVFQELLYLLPS